MPSPSSDENSAVRQSTKTPQSRTGKFFQGIFGKKDPQLTTPPQPTPRTTQRSAIDQPPPELIQVMPEPTDWGDEEESNWDDDFMDEPRVVPAPPPPPPRSIEAPITPEEPLEEEPLEIEGLGGEGAAIETEVAATSDLPTELVATGKTEPEPTAIADEAWDDHRPTTDMPPAVPSSVVPEVGAVPPPATPPVAEAATISVNIPRPKNIKYKTKDSTADAAIAATTTTPSDKVEAVELHIKRPTTIKYKTKPVPQPSIVDQILAPGKAVWHRMKNWTDILPNQFSENPKKILGILAAVLLSITTSWVVVNFWPSNSMAPIAQIEPTVQPTSPTETLVKAVQSQLSTLASQYPAGLIANLELQPEQQTAIITMGNLWFSLTAVQKQQVAQSLWQQSRTYQMSKVELHSSNGDILARSPIVGQDVVVLTN